MQQDILRQSNLYEAIPEWSFPLPQGFQARAEGHEHHLWAPGVSIRLCLTQVAGQLGPEQRRNALRESLPAQAFDVEEDRSDGWLRLAYRLKRQAAHGEVHGLHCAFFTPGPRLDFFAECAEESGIAVARQLLQGIKNHPS
jgi:hypothetical protein